MNKGITIVFVVCPILILGFIVSIVVGCGLMIGLGILLIYTSPAFVAEKNLYAYEMECNIINVLRKSAFGHDLQHGWLSMHKIRQEVEKIFDDDRAHEDQFWTSFKRLRKLEKILKKVIESQKKGERVIRRYRLNENSKYNPKKPRRLTGGKKIRTTHVHA